MKKLTLLFILIISFSACSSSGGDRPPATIRLTGKVSIGITGGGQGNPALGITVTVTNLPKSSIATGIDGLYSISDIPAAGGYTVKAEDTNAGGFNTVICMINIVDSTTMTVTDDGGNGGTAKCTKNGSMILDIVMG